MFIIHQHLHDISIIIYPKLKLYAQHENYRKRPSFDKYSEKSRLTKYNGHQNTYQYLNTITIMEQGF